MMKRLWIILALVIGVLLGYAARDLPLGSLTGRSNTANSIASATDTVSAGVVGSASPAEGEAPSVHAFPLADTFLNYVLPDKSMAQIQIAVDQIRDNTSEESIRGLLDRDVARDLFTGMSEGVNPSFGPLVGALAADAVTIHSFLLPPESDMPVPVLLVMAEWPDVDYTDLRKLLRDPILAGLQDGKPYSKTVGEFTVEGVSAANGNISYVVTDKGVWICNSPGPLEEAFATESLPEPEGNPPLNALLERVSKGLMVGTINLQSKPDGSAGPAGLLALLADLGIQRIALSLGGPTPGVTGFGEFKKTPEWVSKWPPLDTTGLEMSTGGALAVLHASLPSFPSMDFAPDSGMRRDRPSDAQADEQEMQRRPRRGTRRGGQTLARRQVPMMARFLPPARQMSIRLSPGEEELVVWSATFRGETEALSGWVDRFEESPWCQAEETAPGVQQWTFKDGSITETWGIEELILSKNENSLVIYSSEESARLLAKSGGGSGEIVMESPSGQTDETRRIHLSVSAEFLQMLIDGELESLNSKNPNAEAVEKFFGLLSGLVSPLNACVTVTDDGVGIRIDAQDELAAVLGPALIASAFLRGGV
ncbi:MAG: hypothetical protein ABIH23_04210 [bacterium]